MTNLAAGVVLDQEFVMPVSLCEKNEGAAPLS